MQNEPVATNGLIALVLAVATPLLAKLGIDSDGAKQIGALAASAVTAAVSVWRIFAARNKVTPTAK